MRRLDVIFDADDSFSLKWVFRGSLIFDEATSAFDNKTQKQISQALDSMGCTRIIIAHRLSTIRNCDRILVFDNGNVVEDGSYDELIEKKDILLNLSNARG